MAKTRGKGGLFWTGIFLAVLEFVIYTGGSVWERQVKADKTYAKVDQLPGPMQFLFDIKTYLYYYWPYTVGFPILLVLVGTIIARRRASRTA